MNVKQRVLCGFLCSITFAICANKPVNKSSASMPVQGSQRYTLDTIQAVIYTPYGTEIVTQSDTDRPNIAGAQQTLEDLIFEHLLYFDADKHKVAPDDDAVDKYLANVKRQNNMTDDDLNAIFKAAGFTPQEGKNQFKRMQAANTMLDFKVRSGLVVPRKEVQAYYDAHPETSYELEYVALPFSGDKQQQRTQLERFAQTGAGASGLSWGEPFRISPIDIAEDKQFIISMEPGDVYLYESPAGYELYRLKSKAHQLRTLEERYQEIADELRRPKFEQLLEAYRSSLFSNASIIRF